MNFVLKRWIFPGFRKDEKMCKRKKKKASELTPSDRILRNLMRPDGDLLDGSFINNDDKDTSFSRRGTFIDGIEQDVDDL